MNRWLELAKENMEHTQRHQQGSNLNPAYLKQWTAEATAYALIAIAETLQETRDEAEAEAGRQETLALWKAD